MADNDKIKVDLVGNAQSAIDQFNAFTNQTQKLQQQLDKVVKSLNAIEKAGGNAFKMSQSMIAQAGTQTNPSQNSNSNNRVIDQLVKTAQIDLKNSTNAIIASMKLFQDRIEQMIKNADDRVRAVNSTLADVRRLENAARVGGRSAPEIISDKAMDKARADAERENREFNRERSRLRREELDIQRASNALNRQRNNEQTLEAVNRANRKEARFASVGLTETDFYNASFAEKRAIARRIQEAEANARAARVKSPDVADQEAVARRFRLAGAAREYQGGQPLLEERLRTFTDYSLIGGAVASVTALFKGVVDLERELKQFQAITATSNTEMKGFEKQLLDMAAASRFSATELAQTATTLGQAGLSARQVIPALDAVQRLAVASGSSLKEAGDLVTGTLGTFNLQNSEAINIANVFTGALNLTKLTMEKLNLGFQYAGNVARDLGLSYTELTASLGTLANTGIRSGSTLGTGLRQLMIDLQTPTEKAKATFSRLGITLADIDIKANGLTGVLENLRAKGFTTADAFSAFEVRAVSAFSALTNGVDQTRRFERQLQLTSFVMEATDIQMNSLANQFSRLANSVGVLAFRMFKPLVEAFKIITSAAADVVGFFAKYEREASIVGLIFGSLAAGAIVSRIASFAVGLGTIALGFTTIGARAAAAAASVLGFAAAQTTATTAAGIGARAGLGAALGGPVGLAVAGASLAFGAYSLYNANNQTGTDQNKGALSEASGRYDETTAALRRVREETEKLVNQQELLDKNDDARRARILELRQAFTALGLSISDSTRNTGALIEALQKLDTGLNLRAIAENIAQTTKREGLIGSLSTDYENQFLANRRALRGNNSATLGAVAGDAVDAAVGVNRPAPGQSGNEFYASQIAALSELIFMNRDNKPVFDQLNVVLKALQETLSKASAIEAQREALRNDRDQLVQLRFNERANSTGLTGRLNEFSSGYRSELTDIERIKDPIARQTQARAVEESARTSFQRLVDERNKVLEDMTNSGQFSADEIRKLRESTGFNETLNNFIGAVRVVINAGQKTFEEIRNLQINAALDRLNAEISAAQARARSTTNVQVIEEMNRTVQELIRKKFELELEKLKVAASNDPNMQGKLDELIKELNARRDAELARAASTGSETVLEANKAMMRRMNELADRQITQIDNQIKLNQQRQRDPNITAENAKRLTDEFNALIQRREDLIKAQNENIARLNPPQGGLTPSPTAPAAVREVLSGLGTYATRIANLETAGSFNPNARNARSGAYGLFQFLPSTLAGKPDEGLGGLAANNEALKKLLQDNGITNSAQLNEALRTGRITIPVQLQIELMRQFTEGNVRALGSELGASDENKALAHFLGAGGARKLLQAIAAGQGGASALDSGTISALGLSQNNLAATSTNDQVRQFYLNLYNRPIPQNVALSDGQIQRQAADQAVNNARIEALRKQFENDDAALKAKTREAEEAVASARNRLRVAQEGVGLGTRREYEVTEAQRALRLAQINENELKLTANLEVQKRLREEMAKIVGDDEGAVARRAASQERMNQLTAEEKRLRAEVNISRDVNRDTGIDYGRLTQGYLQRQGYLNSNGQVNTSGMIEKGFLDLVGGVDRAFQNLFTTLAMGSKSAGEAFKAFGLSIIQTMMGIISKRLSEALINSLFGGLLGGGGAGGGGGLLSGLLGGGGGGGNFFSSLFSSFGGGGGAAVMSPFALMKNGGFVRAAHGFNVPTRDSVPILAQPGEAILRQSAVSLIGADNITALNNMGNRRMSQSLNNAANENKPAQESKPVNVWVVSPEQVPPPSESDIIATVSNDVRRGGPMKQLIKQVNAGTI